MQVLASQLLFLDNKNAGQAIPPLFWPDSCIKIGHVVLLSDPTVNSLYGSTKQGSRRLFSKTLSVTTEVMSIKTSLGKLIENCRFIYRITL